MAFPEASAATGIERRPSNPSARRRDRAPSDEAHVVDSRAVEADDAGAHGRSGRHRTVDEARARGRAARGAREARARRRARRLRGCTLGARRPRSSAAAARGARRRCAGHRRRGVGGRSDASRARSSVECARHARRRARRRAPEDADPPSEALPSPPWMNRTPRALRGGRPRPRHGAERRAPSPARRSTVSINLPVPGRAWRAGGPRGQARRAHVGPIGCTPARALSSTSRRSRSRTHDETTRAPRSRRRSRAPKATWRGRRGRERHVARATRVAQAHGAATGDGARVVVDARPRSRPRSHDACDGKHVAGAAGELRGPTSAGRRRRAKAAATMDARVSRGRRLGCAARTTVAAGATAETERSKMATCAATTTANMAADPGTHATSSIAPEMPSTGHSSGRARRTRSPRRSPRSRSRTAQPGPWASPVSARRLRRSGRAGVEPAGARLARVDLRRRRGRAHQVPAAGSRSAARRAVAAASLERGGRSRDRSRRAWTATRGAAADDGEPPCCTSATSTTAGAT